MAGTSRLRHVGLGVQLRKWREKSGHSTRSVASSLGISPASVNRTELGTRMPSPEEVSALCALYGVTGDDKRDLMDRVGTNAVDASWFSPRNVSDALQALMVLEREATRATNVELTFVPGLLQTSEYARLLFQGATTSAMEVEQRVATRLGRQGVLSRPGGPQHSFLVDESVIRRHFGNVEVLCGQLDHLLVVGRRNNVSIRVVPFSVDSRAPVSGCFTVFDVPGDGRHVYSENVESRLFSTDDDDVRPFVAALSRLDRHALNEQDSARLIERVREELADVSVGLAQEHP